MAHSAGADNPEGEAGEFPLSPASLDGPSAEDRLELVEKCCKALDQRLVNLERAARAKATPATPGPAISQNQVVQVANLVAGQVLRSLKNGSQGTNPLLASNADPLSLSMEEIIQRCAICAPISRTGRPRNHHGTR